MVFQSGSMKGHYSQLNFLPDTGLGVYTSSSGQEDGSQDIRELAFMYIVMPRTKFLVNFCSFSIHCKFRMICFTKYIDFSWCYAGSGTMA